MTGKEEVYEHIRKHIENLEWRDKAVLSMLKNEIGLALVSSDIENCTDLMRDEYYMKITKFRSEAAAIAVYEMLVDNGYLDLREVGK